MGRKLSPQHRRNISKGLCKSKNRSAAKRKQCNKRYRSRSKSLSPKQYWSRSKSLSPKSKSIRKIDFFQYFNQNAINKFVEDPRNIKIAKSNYNKLFGAPTKDDITLGKAYKCSYANLDAGDMNCALTKSNKIKKTNGVNQGYDWNRLNPNNASVKRSVMLLAQKDILKAASKKELTHSPSARSVGSSLMARRSPSASPAYSPSASPSASPIPTPPASPPASPTPTPSRRQSFAVSPGADEDKLRKSLDAFSKRKEEQAKKDAEEVEKKLQEKLRRSMEAYKERKNSQLKAIEEQKNEMKKIIVSEVNDEKELSSQEKGDVKSMLNDVVEIKAGIRELKIENNPKKAEEIAQKVDKAQKDLEKKKEKASNTSVRSTILMAGMLGVSSLFGGMPPQQEQLALPSGSPGGQIALPGGPSIGFTEYQENPLMSKSP